MWMTSCTGSARRILGDLKKSVSWVESCLGRRRLTFACSRRPWTGVVRDGVGWGVRWKSQNRKNVSLSLCRRTFKLKGNKKFSTWTKKSYVFFVFRDSYVLCIYVTNIMNVLRTGMNMPISRIYIWLWYIARLVSKLSRCNKQFLL